MVIAIHQIFWLLLKFISQKDRYIESESYTDFCWIFILECCPSLENWMKFCMILRKIRRQKLLNKYKAIHLQRYRVTKLNNVTNALIYFPVGTFQAAWTSKLANFHLFILVIDWIYCKPEVNQSFISPPVFSPFPSVHFAKSCGTLSLLFIW